MSPTNRDTGRHERISPNDDEPEFKAVTRDDVSDYALLPRRFDLLKSEVAELLALLRGTVLPAIARIDRRLVEIERHDVASTSQVHDRLDVIAKSIDTLAKLILDGR
jgi:hypothetical protein